MFDDVFRHENTRGAAHTTYNCARLKSMQGMRYWDIRGLRNWSTLNIGCLKNVPVWRRSFAVGIERAILVLVPPHLLERLCR
jgi:hypothetical protein